MDESTQKQGFVLYKYEALDAHSRTVTGDWWASSHRQAEFWLERQGLREITLQPSSMTTSEVRVSLSHLTLFYSQLSILFSSGVTLRDSLSVTAQTPDPSLKAVCGLLEELLESGSSLSRAMSLFPGVFGPVTLGLISAAEKSGQLHRALARLAESTKRLDELKKSVIAAATYPAIVVFSTLLLAAVFLFYIFPLNHNLISSNDRPASSFGQLISSLAALFGNPWTPVVTAAFIGGLFIFGHRVLHDRSSKERLYELLVQTPVIGPFCQKMEAVQTLEAMSLIITGGGTVDYALRLLIRSAPYKSRKTSLQMVREEIIAGGDFSESLKVHRILPSIYTSLLRVGHETGRLQEMLAHSGRLCKTDIERSLETLTALLEPLLLGFAGCLAGAAIILSALPLLDMISSL